MLLICAEKSFLNVIDSCWQRDLLGESS